MASHSSFSCCVGRPRFDTRVPTLAPPTCTPAQSETVFPLIPYCLWLTAISVVGSLRRKALRFCNNCLLLFLVEVSKMSDSTVSTGGVPGSPTTKSVSRRPDTATSWNSDRGKPITQRVQMTNSPSPPLTTQSVSFIMVIFIRNKRLLSKIKK